MNQKLKLCCNYFILQSLMYINWMSLSLTIQTVKHQFAGIWKVSASCTSGGAEEVTASSSSIFLTKNSVTQPMVCWAIHFLLTVC